MTDHPTILLGAYVLGALEPDEHRTVDEHLAQCAACAAETADLAALPPLLATLTDEDLDGLHAASAPPAELFDRVAGEVEARHPATPWWRRTRALVAAAAAAVLIGGGVGGWSLASGGGHPHTYSASAAGMRMHVRLTSAESGTGLHVDVTGLPTDEHCTLIAQARDGSNHVAGQWVATYSGAATMTGSTDVPAAQLRRVVLLGTERNPLLSVNL